VFVGGGESYVEFNENISKLQSAVYVKAHLRRKYKVNVHTRHDSPPPAGCTTKSLLSPNTLQPRGSAWLIRDLAGHRQISRLQMPEAANGSKRR